MRSVLSSLISETIPFPVYQVNHEVKLRSVRIVLSSLTSITKPFPVYQVNHEVKPNSMRGVIVVKHGFVY